VVEHVSRSTCPDHYSTNFDLEKTCVGRAEPRDVMRVALRNEHPLAGLIELPQPDGRGRIGFGVVSRTCEKPIGI
jgi:hypothetical protein